MSENPVISPEILAEEILRQTAARGPAESICPSEVARALAESWRPLLGPVRRAAAELARQGQVEILRKGKPVPADPPPKGVIRLRATGGT